MLAGRKGAVFPEERKKKSKYWEYKRFFLTPLALRIRKIEQLLGERIAYLLPYMYVLMTPQCLELIRLVTYNVLYCLILISISVYLPHAVDHRLVFILPPKADLVPANRSCEPVGGGDVLIQFHLSASNVLQLCQSASLADAADGDTVSEIKSEQKYQRHLLVSVGNRIKIRLKSKANESGGSRRLFSALSSGQMELPYKTGN